MRILACLLLLIASFAFAAPAWHTHLYVGGGDYWRARVPISFTNAGQTAIAGSPAELTVGTGPGEIPIAGARVQELRLVDDRGIELLWELTTAGSTPVREGLVQQGMKLIVPAVGEPGATSACWLYFDNPAAWSVPDYYSGRSGVANAGVEEGAGITPAGWVHDTGDVDHKADWVKEAPHSGQRCLKLTVAPGAERSWIATRQSGLVIRGGSHYVFEGWVRAEEVVGEAGWYIHLGNENNYMITSPMATAGGGTYGWTKVTAEFDAPPEADRADLGTVLWGTGTAWFDEVSLTTGPAEEFSVSVGDVERFAFDEVRAPSDWSRAAGFEQRLPVRLINTSPGSERQVLALVDTARLTAATLGRLEDSSLLVIGPDGVCPHSLLAGRLLFEVTLPPTSRVTCYVYFAPGQRAAPGQDRTGYEKLMNSQLNLARNPSFEEGDALPTEWEGGTEGERMPQARMIREAGGLFGEWSARLSIPSEVTPAWTGWRQIVPASAETSYLYAAWLKTEDVTNGSAQLHAHLRKASGEMCEAGGFAGVGPALAGSQDWTLLTGMLSTPFDCGQVQLHLTMLATGSLQHDGVLLAEVAETVPGAIEGRSDTSELTVWAVNPVVKVFPDTLPAPDEANPAALVCARNEAEPLQLAVRGSQALSEVSVEAAAPTGPTGALPAPTIEIVGYVPCDVKTNYYSWKGNLWERKLPPNTPSGDGWAGLWPDPLRPEASFELRSLETSAVWLTFTAPSDAQAGLYSGRISLVSGGQQVAEMPYTVRVPDFSLPTETTFPAIYDVRVDSHWVPEGGTREQAERAIYKVMADHRACPSNPVAAPRIDLVDGKLVFDFNEFDAACEVYFNEFDFPHSYTPWMFYLFGWGHPPGEKWGQQPYEGEYPFTDADRSKLEPGFVRVYQEALTGFWNHLEEKGWADRFVLYISDEPWMDRISLQDQMKALCDMIHEVDASIPIYCSTWGHQAAWNGYLDVWGVGQYGVFSTDEMAKRKTDGDRLRFTTDGQMCTDTPYLACERLLPWYCFRYGVEAYEFWGADWLTYDPWQFGWHSFIDQSGEPGERSWVRYPNGDGYLLYPGWTQGFDAPCSSLRLEAAREGVEDYLYLQLLASLVAKADAAGKDASKGKLLIEEAKALVPIPNAGGRVSTSILPDPDGLIRLKRAIADAIEELQN